MTDYFYINTIFNYVILIFNMIISRVEIDSTGGPSTQPVQITAQVAGRSYEIGPNIATQTESLTCVLEEGVGYQHY